MLAGHYLRHLLMTFSFLYLLANTLFIEGLTQDQYLGCFYDNSSQSPPWENSFSNNSMDIELCIKHCRTAGTKTYAKLLNGTVCQCGDDYGVQLSDLACNLTCAGNQSEYCGGVTNKLSTTYVLYAVCPTGNYSTKCDRVCHCKRQIPCDRTTGQCPDGCDRNYTGSTCNTSISATYIGCFQDNVPDRALPNSVHYEEYIKVTIDVCIGWCTENSSSFAGAQYGGECYCGESYDKYGQLNESRCFKTCNGNRSQICGGDNANSVYSVCPAGYYGTDCSRRCNCLNDGRCFYRNGSCFSSQCKPGWTGSSCNIRDIDECAITPSVCGEGGINCTNAIGGYSCYCKNDQKTYNMPCPFDTDECLESPSRCGASSINCTNTYGSFICLCKDGREIDNGHCGASDISRKPVIEVIVGAVVGSVFGIALIALLTVVAARWCKRNRCETPPKELSSSRSDAKGTIPEQQYSSLVKTSVQPNSDYDRLNHGTYEVVNAEAQPASQNSDLSSFNADNTYEQL